MNTFLDWPDLALPPINLWNVPVQSFGAGLVRHDTHGLQADARRQVDIIVHHAGEAQPNNFG